jgi:hypothetical protein
MRRHSEARFLSQAIKDGSSGSLLTKLTPPAINSVSISPVQAK